MNLRKLIQSILDKTLLKDGVLSHHLKRVLPDKIDATTTKKVNNDEYVVFRFYAPPRRIYGDGKPKIARHLIDVNYYYSYDKSDARFDDAEKRVNAVLSEFLSDTRFLLAVSPHDVTDVSNDFRGINFQLSFISTVDYVKENTT